MKTLFIAASLLLFSTQAYAIQSAIDTNRPEQYKVNPGFTGGGGGYSGNINTDTEYKYGDPIDLGGTGTTGGTGTVTETNKCTGVTCPSDMSCSDGCCVF